MYQFSQFYLLILLISLYLFNSYAWNIKPMKPSSSAAKLSREMSKIGKGLMTAAILSAATNINPVFATPQEDGYIDSLKVLLMSKELIKPIESFTIAQKYDQARSNVRYTTDQLQLQKKCTYLIKNSLDFVEDPEIIDAAGTVAADIGNTAVQVDGTIYALAFLPGDEYGVLPPSAEKYIKETVDYVKKYDESIDILLKLGNEEQLGKAKKLADEGLKAVPPKFFKTN